MNEEILISKMQELEKFLEKASYRITWIQEELEEKEIEDENITSWIDDLEYFVSEANDIAEIVECRAYDEEEE